MSVLEQSAVARAAAERVQALQLAQRLQTREPSELRAVANSNPALLREWIAEIAIWHEQSQAEANRLQSVLDTLYSAERCKRLEIAA